MGRRASCRSSDCSGRLNRIALAAPKIALRLAAQILDVPERSLRERAAEGLITVERRASGRVRALVDLEQLRGELAALGCRAPGCDAPVHRAGRFCSHACSTRRYAAETRTCEQCGRPFDVEGHRARQPGAARFCSSKCVAEWRWANDRSSFPQGARRGAEKPCPQCDESPYRPPSHEHLEHCSPSCAGETRRAWEQTEAGRQARALSVAGQQAWWERERATLQLPLAIDVALELGVSVPTVTRHYIPCGKLTAEPLTLGGQRVLTFPRATSELPTLARARARGAAWSTWLDPEWRVQRELRTGRLAGAEAEAALRQTVGAIRSRLGPRRRGRRDTAVRNEDWQLRYDGLRDLQERLEAAGEHDAELASSAAIRRMMAREDLGSGAAPVEVEALAEGAMRLVLLRAQAA